MAADMALTDAQMRRLKMLRDVPQGGERCRAFEGHGYSACIALVERGLAVEVGKHGLGGAFQITPAGAEALSSQL
jgi:hypothetical protein